MHAWRILRYIIPTKKGVGLQLECEFCGMDKEDSLHLFKNCRLVNLLWKNGPLSMELCEHLAMFVSEWLCDMLETLGGYQLEVFLYTLRAIWVERNNVVWRGGCFLPLNVARWLGQ